MGRARVYLDHNATTAVRPSAIARMAEVLAEVGNPSAVHQEGRAKRRVVEEARRSVAALIGADAGCVTFTSGATEALNLALTPSATDGDPRPVTRLALSSGEHAAVAAGARFPAEARVPLPLDRRGVIELAAVEEAFARHAAERPGERMTLALTAADNVTGVIQPVSEACAIAKRFGGLAVVDATQAAGKIPVDMAAIGCDFLALSAHKFGGPAGVGALARSRETLRVSDPILKGGGQEGGWRAGTENAAGIAGLGVAAEEARRDLPGFARLAALRDGLEAGLRALGEVVVFGEGAPRLPNTSCFARRGVAAQSALIALDLAGIAVSAGPACSSGKPKAPPVLDAMGVTHDLSVGMLRISFGWTSKPSDVERFLGAWAEIAGRAAPKRPATAA